MLESKPVVLYSISMVDKMQVRHLHLAILDIPHALLTGSCRSRQASLQSMSSRQVSSLKDSKKALTAGLQQHFMLHKRCTGEAEMV